MGDTFITISIIAAFLIVNVAIIKIFHKKQDSLEEYAVGGRSFPWILSLFGYLGAFYVGSIYTGFFATSATVGVFAQYLAVYSVASILTLYIMARPVWIWGKNHNLETNFDIVTLRYKSQKLGMFIGITSFLFWTPWLIVEMQTLGYIVSAITYGAVPFWLGLVVISSIVIVYVSIGGMRAGAIGDLFQGILFTFAGTATVIYLIYKVYGGITPLFEQVANHNPDLLIITQDTGALTWTSVIVVASFGAMMFPGIFNRIYMAESVRSMKKTVIVAPLVGSLLILFLMWLGLGGSLQEGFPEDPQSGVFWMADQYGGPVILGLMGIFALAACMSTLSAITTTAAVIIGKNLVGFGFKWDRKKMLRNSKLFSYVVGIVCMIIACLDIPAIITIIQYVYDCIAQAAVPIILGLYWKRGNKYGAAVGAAAGMAIVLLQGPFPWLVSWTGGMSGGLLGLGVNLVLYVVVSLLTSRQPHVDALFEELESKTASKPASDQMDLGSPKKAL